MTMQEMKIEAGTVKQARAVQEKLRHTVKLIPLKNMPEPTRRAHELVNHFRRGELIL